MPRNGRANVDMHQWNSESASMRGYIKENIPKCMTFTVSYSQLMDTSPCINVARRTTFLTTSVRISPAYFTENLLSHRSSLNRFIFVSLLLLLLLRKLISFIFYPLSKPDGVGVLYSWRISVVLKVNRHGFLQVRYFGNLISWIRPTGTIHII